MTKTLARELKILFVQTLRNTKGFKYGEGNPFHMQIGTMSYFVFLKNISPAYFVNSPDITRVQLPYSKHFSKVLKTKTPFLILGYDGDNDIFVTWNPRQIKERLNSKRNVSLYSRRSIQSEIKGREFKEAYLSNGDKIVIFKREVLISLFDNLNSYFNKTIIPSQIEIVEEPGIQYNQGKLTAILDKNILHLLRPLLKQAKVLEAVNVCSKYYNNEYPSMTFKDWFQLVNQVYKQFDNT